MKQQSSLAEPLFGFINNLPDQKRAAGQLFERLIPLNVYHFFRQAKRACS
jgi:hypothetical protein